MWTIDRRNAGDLGRLAAALLVGALAPVWAWNSVGAGLLALPEARYVHGLALLVALAAATLVTALAARLGVRHQP